ncbi:MAG: hypothetical protein JWO87_2883 [Phycisphaerales bacterium]|nr:hypothetical protein [Phycisphaerales bacterium]
MSTEDSRFQRAIERIDAANAQDPSRAIFGGRELPSELFYAQRMSTWLDRLEPTASEALRLAVRCQHLMRWVIPRSQYPMTRPGYHQWRTRLGAFHAEQAGEILREVGYDDAFIARVQSLIRKERLKADPETQTLEDAACLVFLEIDYVDFARRHEEAKVVEILRKTWRKMSDRGHAAALELAGELPEAEQGLIEKALAAK